MHSPISLLTALLLLDAASPTPRQDSQIALTAHARHPAAKSAHANAVYLTLRSTHAEGTPRGLCVSRAGHYATQREQCAKVCVERSSKGGIAISSLNYIRSEPLRQYYSVNKAGELDAGLVNGKGRTSKYLLQGTLSNSFVAMQSSATYQLLKAGAYGKKHVIKPAAGGEYLMMLEKDLDGYNWHDGDDLPEASSEL